MAGPVTIYRHVKRLGNIVNHPAKGISTPGRLTVTPGTAQRKAYPGIYGDPREVAAEAARRVGPEDPALQQLFGVSRGELSEIARSRTGTITDPQLPGATKNPRVIERIMGEPLLSFLGRELQPLSPIVALAGCS